MALSKYILKFDGVYKIIKDTKQNQMIMSVGFLLVMSIIKRRPDFKVIIMSATIDKTIFTDYFYRLKSN